METYYIYKFTNKLNNMSYIGQSINPEKRKMEHLYGRINGKNPYFDRVLKKHGLENFDFEIIDSANTQEDIDKLEKEYIIKYNSLKPNGYNILKGGREQRGAWNSKPIDEYDLFGNYINSYESAGYYQNFINKDYDSRMIRRSCTEHKHYKDRIFRFKGDSKPQPYKKPKSNKCIKVYQFDENGILIEEYNSIKDASEKTNTSRTSIIGCLKGYYKKANNYFWSYEDRIEIKQSDKVRIKTIIYQCDENKKIINKYYNTREAEIDNNFKYDSYKQILKYLDTDKMYSNYYWYRVKFYEENIVPSLNKS